MCLCVCVSSYAILFYSLFESVLGIIQEQLQLICSGIQPDASPTMGIFGLLARSCKQGFAKWPQTLIAWQKKEEKRHVITIILIPAGDMLDLLKWRAHPERISDSLSKLKEIDGSEIVKVSCTSEPCCLVNEHVNHSNLCPNWCTLLIQSNIFYQFLQDTLDTLFGILDESSQKYALKVFDCLVGKVPHFLAQYRTMKLHFAYCICAFFVI